MMYTSFFRSRFYFRKASISFKKNSEAYEEQSAAGVAAGSAGLMFELRHAGGDCITFAADNESLAEKWMAALRSVGPVSKFARQSQLSQDFYIAS